MSTTTNNLNLIKPEENDLVDVNVFSSNFEVLDGLGVDYIIEQGSAAPASSRYSTYPIDGYWNYRKWKSGWMELWGIFTVRGIGSRKCEIQYPVGVKLLSDIVCTATCKQDGNVNSYLRHCSGNQTLLDIYAGGVTDESSSQQFSAHIFGKYK